MPKTSNENLNFANSRNFVRIFRNAANRIARYENIYSCTAIEGVTGECFSEEARLWGKMHFPKGSSNFEDWFIHVPKFKRRKLRITLLREAALNIAIQCGHEFKNGNKRK